MSKIPCNNGAGECMLREKCNPPGRGKTVIVDFEVEERAMFDNKPRCIGLQMCCENFNKSEKLTEQTTEKPTIMTVTETCGTRNDEGFLYTLRNNMDIAQFGEFPWQVALTQKEMDGDEMRCTYIGGGSLIHKSFVLTAATKVIDKIAADLIARVGEFDFASASETFQHEDMMVKKIIIHEGFIRRGAIPNNIALLQLEKPVTLDQHINLICLPPPNAKFDNKRCIATGWGKHQYTDPDIKYPTLLKKIEMSVIPTPACEIAIKKESYNFEELPPGIICAGGGQEDTCKGDGGSPLVCAGDNGTYYQVGIVSWGLGCKKVGVPGAYTEVSFSEPDEEYPSILKKSEMLVHDKATCDKAYKDMSANFNGLIPGIICAGGGVKDTCEGHGGSPLGCYGNDGAFYQIGIAAWGFGCKKSEAPIAYTEVSHYVDWIHRKIYD
ncbi:unnamed protein product [Diamesa tonsa]